MASLHRRYPPSVGGDSCYENFLRLLIIKLLIFYFTLTFHSSELVFLDLLIKIGPDNRISTTYRKPTSGNSILHAGSQRPKHLMYKIPTSQYVWLRRNCTCLRDFKQQPDILRSRLRSQGYNEICLKRAYQHALDSGRSKLIHPKCKPNPQD